jgi:hypothetical protein
MKQQKMATDAAAEQDKLELEEERIRSHERIAGLQVGAKKSADEANLAFKREEAGLRMGMEISKQTDMPAEEEEVNSFEEGGSVSEKEKNPVKYIDRRDRRDRSPTGTHPPPEPPSLRTPPNPDPEPEAQAAMPIKVPPPVPLHPVVDDDDPHWAPRTA